MLIQKEMLPLATASFFMRGSYMLAAMFLGASMTGWCLSGEELMSSIGLPLNETV